MSFIKAVHLRPVSSDTTDKLVRYIKEGLAPLGINTLCLEFNPGYNYKCFPELANSTFGRDDAKKVAAAAKEAGIRIVPLFMCLGHQGWMHDKNTLLTAHPEFDETPHITKENDPKRHGWDFYCHRWCASNDDVYKYVFPMMDEIMEDFGADCLHVGMDEVFYLADEDCPRCKGKNRAELFARTVKILHEHIVNEKGWQMMMWADRLNKADDFGYSGWDGDIWGTWEARDMIPTDIILTDWHYDMNEKGFPGIEALIERGFTVVPACWNDAAQARYLWSESQKHAASAAVKGYNGKLGGLIVTSWKEVDDELLDLYLEVVKNREHHLEEKGLKGVASSVVFVGENL
jgi:hypothetical protein